MANKLLLNLFPLLVQELQTTLIDSEEASLADQLLFLKILTCSYDDECQAGYIRVESASHLNAIEQKIIGLHHGRTISVQHPCDVYLDIDNFGRITGIEILDGFAYANQLLKLRD